MPGRARRRAAVGLLALLLLAAAPGEGRLDLRVTPDVDDEGVRVGVEAGLGTLGVHTGAEADDDGVRVTDPPMYDAVGTDGARGEELYGPPVAAAALGTGGLTAGLREDGVLTNLSWPGPGLYEHVNYRTASRDWPNEGAPANAGSFAGLLVPGESGTWLTRSDGWEVAAQGYAGRGSPVLRTELVRDGVRVVLRDVVHPELDVLARDVEVQGAPEGAVLAYLANMNPTTTRTPRVPSTTDGILDDVGDFATVHDAEAGAMLHFRPLRLDPAAATVAATGELGAAPTARALAATFGDGVYVAVAGDEPPAAVQAGLDTLGLVGGEAEGTGALGPYRDARDGTLSGASVAVGKTAGAQRWEEPDGTVYLAADDDPRDALATIERARALGFDGIRAAAEADWDAWLADTRLPATDDARVRAVTERALMLIRTAQDRRTGAIVANTTTQTPYRQDWVRDGAFFNYALLVAGQPEMVAAHNDFYRRAQSVTGTWDPILCTDGAHCSAMFPFEIDAQAFGVWALWQEHALGADDERLAASYDAIRRGAEVLLACRDPRNGLQCVAHEDDAVAPSQGAQGAATVYLGLRSAARAAEALGHADDRERFDARADELRAAAIEQLCADGCGTGRGSIYLVWPGRLLTDPPVEELQPTLDAMREQLAARVAGERPAPGGHFQYPMEALFALATGGEDTAAHRRLLEEAVAWLAHDVAAEGVLHFGERIFHEGDGVYRHSVGFPHVWSGAETYLAAALVHGVEGCPAGQRVGDVACADPAHARDGRE